MARVTVEDCAEVVPSRFELVALAAQRAKTIAAGGELTVSRDNDKNAVVALREIAERTVDADKLREQVIQGRQEKVNVDEYGVEEISDEIDNGSFSAKEAAEEMAALQGSRPASISEDDDEEELLFEEDNLDIED